ncbi:amidase [Brachybacterium sp. FME24]|uniref:amidase n=1 Tax=Brachybacterium sp. FME24 TaxID=2742605 RepID=UPI0018686C7A|nr:amidase [Brachybacterium sp. FME24]
MTPADAPTVAQAASHLTRGDLSSRELTDACLSRIDAMDADLRAFITVYADRARQQADAADDRLRRGQVDGPLHGLPLAVKDNLSVSGQVTTMGSAIFRDHVASETAGVVDRLEAQGSVLLGKTNLHEFALGVTTENPHFGICRNPWDRDRTPGGSSGGSAVAVATGMSLGAIGSDTSGSIRIPAAACGLVGLKPTYGRVSTHGCYPEAWSLDHVGVLTRTVEDAAMMFDAVSGHDPRVATSLDLPPSRTAGELQQGRPLRIGIEEQYFFADVDPEVEAVVRQMLDSLARAGAQIQPVVIPSLRDATYALTVIDTAETTAFHDEQFQHRAHEYGEDVRLLVECGALTTAVDYLHAQQIRSQVRDDFRSVFTEVDVIASPTLPIRTPRVGESVVRIEGEDRDRDGELMRLVGPANLAGLPSISVPCAALYGMPVGMQFVGPALGEAAVLRAAAAVEALYRLPALPAQRGGAPGQR